MTSMPAYRIVRPGDPPEWCEVEVPVPGPGEVLIRMGGAGLCRTDLEVIARGTTGRPFERPFTLGHENAGWVERLGPGVTDLSLDQPVVVSAIRSCGACRPCRLGSDNHCRDLRSRGLREDGGIAPYMVADRRQLVPIDGLDPRVAAPLADAGLTAMGAVASLESLLGGQPRIAVVGVGGLGLLAVQFVRVLAPGAWIAALDADASRAEEALALGADAAYRVGTDMALHPTVHHHAHDVDDLTAVLDFVGTDATMAWAARSTTPPGAIVVCGRGGGVLPFSRERVSAGVDLRGSRGGSIHDVHRAVDWTRRGLVSLPLASYPYLEAERAYDDLRHGRVRGRAVLSFAGA